MPQPPSTFAPERVGPSAFYSETQRQGSNARVACPQPNVCDPMGVQPQQQPNHSFVSSCAVESTQQNSCPMDWVGATAPAKAVVKSSPLPAAPHLAACRSGAQALAADEDSLKSAVAAATAAVNPWAWLSEVAVGDGGTGAAPACRPTKPQQDEGVASHATSRRLFTAIGAPDPKSHMQWRLQQQAQQLQAELAFATQQLHMHGHAFSASSPAVPSAG